MAVEYFSNSNSDSAFPNPNESLYDWSQKNQGTSIQCEQVRTPSEGSYTDNETEYSYRTEEIETICVNGDTIYHSSVYNTEATKDGTIFHQSHTESSRKEER